MGVTAYVVIAGISRIAFAGIAETLARRAAQQDIDGPACQILNFRGAHPEEIAAYVFRFREIVSIRLNGKRIIVNQQAEFGFPPRAKRLPSPGNARVELDYVILLLHSHRHWYSLGIVDSISRAARSRVMASVRSHGNRSTELVLRMALTRAGIGGWRLHPRDLSGVPDFWFPDARLAVFVDGCFWHGCERCLRLPKDNRRYWREKIAGNVARARAVDRALRTQRIAVVRIWEHELRQAPTRDEVIRRLLRFLNRR